jgi:hypothetical protein
VCQTTTPCAVREHWDAFEATMGGGDDGSVPVRARDGTSHPPSPLADLLASSAEDLERDYWLSTSPRLDVTPRSMAMLDDFGEVLVSDAAPGPWYALEAPVDSGRERAPLHA